MEIPRSALILGFAGILPFLWGAFTVVVPEVRAAVVPYAPRLVGPFLQLNYGIIILSFMSGVLWGFATKSGDRQWLCYSLSTLPALWCLFMVRGGAENAAIMLIIGYVALLGLDWLFDRWGLTPEWWMQLRVLLTTLVAACLSIGILI